MGSEPAPAAMRASSSMLRSLKQVQGSSQDLRQIQKIRVGSRRCRGSRDERLGSSLSERWEPAEPRVQRTGAEQSAALLHRALHARRSWGWNGNQCGSRAPPASQGLIREGNSEGLASAPACSWSPGLHSPHLSMVERWHARVCRNRAQARRESGGRRRSGTLRGY